MKYPAQCKNVIDVTKPPYSADNTGTADCTEAIRHAMDDALRAYLPALKATKQKLTEMSNGLTEDAYIGRESGHVEDGKMWVTLPEFAPDAVILYFPDGVYRVHDTLTYTLQDLNALQRPGYVCELCRNIHLCGQSTRGTVIRLDDHAPGFDALKPILSFNNKALPGDREETTNCAQMNTLEDMTIDAGTGNEGAIGVMYSSSNCGRIENVCLTGQGGYCGIYMIMGTQGCFRHISVGGFDYGLDAVRTSPVVLDDFDASLCRKAGIISHNASLVCKRIHTGALPALMLRKGTMGRYVMQDASATVQGDTAGNHVYFPDKNALLQDSLMPESDRLFPEDCAFTDAFGAVGDGVTDDTKAIQKAMNSGRSVIVFGKGTYRLNGTVHIPASVKKIDFMWCNLAGGELLVTGEAESVFEIDEEDNSLLFMEHLMTHEQLYGYCYFVKHTAKRDVVFHDIAVVFCAHYLNTVGGSRVYFDNCFQTVGTYAQNLALVRRGLRPVFCGMIPYVFRNQQVWGDNLNAERADLHILNDGSSVYLNGLKTEGPGIALRAINGGQTQVNLLKVGIWINRTEAALLEAEASRLRIWGTFVYYYNHEAPYHTLTDCNGQKIDLLDAGEQTDENGCLVDLISR